MATLQQNRSAESKFYPIEHQGVCAARNVGIKEAQGKYLAFLVPADNKWRVILEIMIASRMLSISE